MTEGPSSDNMSLEEGLNSLTQFRTQLVIKTNKLVAISQYHSVSNMI